MSESACRAAGLSVAYRADPVLENVNMTVPDGAFMGIVGPNGAGKSTLIKAMLGLVPTLTGEASFFGQPLDRVRRRVGYMPQSTSVDWDFPTTVLNVVTMGTYGRLGWFVRPGRRERTDAREALERTGIPELADRQIGALSGGQKQRVFLARMLVAQPDLLVMDEPFAGIDARSQNAILEVLLDLRSRGHSLLMVHHDLAGVAKVCDHVTLLNRHVIASGPTDVVYTRENIRAAYNVGDADDTFAELIS